MGVADYFHLLTAQFSFITIIIIIIIIIIITFM